MLSSWIELLNCTVSTWPWVKVPVFPAMGINHLIALSGCRLGEAEVKRLMYTTEQVWVRVEGGKCDLWQNCLSTALVMRKNSTKRIGFLPLAGSFSFSPCFRFFFKTCCSLPFTASPHLLFYTLPISLTLSFLLLPRLSLHSLSLQSVLLDQA